MAGSVADAVFVPDGDAFVPTENAAGPWDPNALHGGAPAALMARALEAVDPGIDMFVSRLTVEFMRPVPMAPLHLKTAVIRPGRRVQLLQASLESGGQEVARATAWRRSLRCSLARLWQGDGASTGFGVGPGTGAGDGVVPPPPSDIGR